MIAHATRSDSNGPRRVSEIIQPGDELWAKLREQGPKP